MSEEKKKAVDGEFELVQVPTEHQLAVKKSNGDIMSINELIVDMANKLEKLETYLLGRK